MLTFLRELMAHSEWANAVFFHTWGKSPARDHEEMRRRVGHIIGVQQGFLAILRGESPGGPPNGPPVSTTLKERQWPATPGCATSRRAWIRETLVSTVRIPWFPDPPCVITVAEAMVQVAMHSQHHRGQCMTRLKDFGR